MRLFQGRNGENGRMRIRLFLRRSHPFPALCKRRHAEKAEVQSRSLQDYNMIPRGGDALAHFGKSGEEQLACHVGAHHEREDSSRRYRL